MLALFIHVDDPTNACEYQIYFSVLKEYYSMLSSIISVSKSHGELLGNMARMELT